MVATWEYTAEREGRTNANRKGREVAESFTCEEAWVKWTSPTEIVIDSRPARPCIGLHRGSKSAALPQQCIAAFKFPGPSLSLARGARAHLTQRATARSMHLPWCKSRKPAICISNNYINRSEASVTIPAIGQIKAEIPVSISASSVFRTSNAKDFQ